MHVSPCAWAVLALAACFLASSPRGVRHGRLLCCLPALPLPACACGCPAHGATKILALALNLARACTSTMRILDRSEPVSDELTSSLRNLTHRTPRRSPGDFGEDLIKSTAGADLHLFIPELLWPAARCHDSIGTHSPRPPNPRLYPRASNPHPCAAARDFHPG